MRYLSAAGMALCWAIAAVPALGQETLADPKSTVGLVGQLIVDSADGRSYDEAYATTQSSFNPYGLDRDLLLAASGMKRLSRDMTGAAVRPGELSILQQFSTPSGKFTPSVEYPPLIPFAFLADGKCLAGYSAGFPAPTATYAVDLGAAPCSAYSVEEMRRVVYQVRADEEENAALALSDADLERVVRAAYVKATDFASVRGNYFAKDGNFGLLRDAIAAAVATDFPTVTVPDAMAADLDTARLCLAGPGTELRIALNTFGDGLSLVAVTYARVFSYHYDPHESSEIVVAPADPCIKP